MADSDRRYCPDDGDGGEEYPLRERLHEEAAVFMEFEEEVQEVVVGGEGRAPETNRLRGSAPRNKEFPQPSEACWSGSALEEVDGLLCPICYHGRSDGGDHAVCCLPCGHIFGMSCIKRWLQQRKKSGKCPKCNVGCTVKGIRRLYASQLVTVEEEPQKRIRDLEDFENEAKWTEQSKACMSRQAELENKLVALEELFDMQQQPNDGSSCQLELQTSLVKPLEAEDIALPSGTKAVKDLHVSPIDGKLILYASSGKTLSILSIEGNNVVLGYKFPVGAWSCSWDINSPHYIYAGLQNGLLMTFDVRQTQKPLEAHDGLTCDPIHTTCSVMQKRPGGMSTVLTASSFSTCEWTIGSAEESPFLFSPQQQRSCFISSQGRDVSGGESLSQISSTPSSLGGTVVPAQHVCLRRIGSSYLKLSSANADMSDVDLPRFVIMDLKNGKEMFASDDGETNDLVLREMSSLSTSGISGTQLRGTKVI